MRASPLRRLSALLLPVLVLAILAGLLSHGTGDSVRAQTGVWNATLTVDISSSGLSVGCADDSTFVDDCATALSNNAFTYQGVSYVVQSIESLEKASGSSLRVYFNDGHGTGDAGVRLKSALNGLTLYVDDTALAVSKIKNAETGGHLVWLYDPNPDWTDGQQVTLSLKVSASTAEVFVTAVDYASLPPNGSHYRRGEHVAVAVTWNKPVKAANDRLWVTLELDEGSGKTTTIEARYHTGSGTNRFIFTDIVADGDAAPNGFTVPYGHIRFNPKNRRHYEDNYGSVDWRLRNINSAGKAAQVINGNEGRVTCNAEGSHCLISRYSSLVPDGVPPGRSFRLLFITPGTTVATATNINDYHAFVQGQVANKDAWKELQPHLRAVANATQGNDLKTNTRTQPNTGTQVGDLGAWAPIFWVGGGKVANNYANFYGGAWTSTGGDSSAVSGPDGPLAVDASVPYVWTGTLPDGSPSYASGSYDSRLGAAWPAVGDPTTAGRELNAVATAEATQAGVYGMYAITPLLTVQWEPKNR